MRHLLLLDSGSGALAVLRQLLPLRTPRITVLADLAGQPYGTREPAFVRQRIRRLLPILHAQKADLVIIACNTTWTVARDLLQSLPVQAVAEVGLRVLKEAPFQRILVLATPLTVRSGWYARIPGKQIRQLPCDNWVEVAEKRIQDALTTGDSLQPSLSRVAEEARHAEAVFLGCTHYPLLSPLLSTLRLPLLDPAVRLRTLLPSFLRGPGAPRVHLLLTRVSSSFLRRAQALLGLPVTAEEVPLAP